MQPTYGRNGFHEHYARCLDLLPDKETKDLFECCLLGCMNIYLSEESVAQCIEVALDLAQRKLARKAG